MISLYPIILISMIGLLEIQQLRLHMISAARIGAKLVAKENINENEAALALRKYFQETSGYGKLLKDISIHRFTKFPSALFFELYEIKIKALIKNMPLEESLIIEEEHQDEIKL
ncbi:MAG: hypothetical protein ACKVQC_06645 [Elusimicrobiota bacterium]